MKNLNSSLALRDEVSMVRQLLFWFGRRGGGDVYFESGEMETRGLAGMRPISG